MRSRLIGLFGGLKGRILADAGARGWSAILSLVLVPIYLRFVGVEAYGLIGTFASIQAILALLDFGLGASLTRELARTEAMSGDWARARDLTRTMEIIYWGLAVLAATGLVVLAPFIADHWLNVDKLTPGEVRRALDVGALAICVQWAGTLYIGGLLGLQQQRRIALVNAIGVTVRAALTIAVLWGISASVEAMLWVQAATGLASTLALAIILWTTIPGRGAKPLFKPELLRGIWRFASGLSGVAVLSLILMQADKIVLSKLLRLDELGYYMLANTMAAGLYVLVTPVFGAIFPRLTELVANKSREALADFYHLASQIMSIVVLPIAAVLVFFSHDMLVFWTGDIEIAQAVQWILVLLATGNLINGLMNPPYALQLAHGWTSLAFYASLVGTVIFIPLLIAATLAWGTVGAAASWAAFNVGALLLVPPILHRYLLTADLWHWYRRDVFAPVVVSFLAAFGCRLLVTPAATRLEAALHIAPALLAAALSVSFASAPIRAWARSQLGAGRTL